MKLKFSELIYVFDQPLIEAAHCDWINSMEWAMMLDHSSMSMKACIISQAMCLQPAATFSPMSLAIVSTNTYLPLPLLLYCNPDTCTQQTKPKNLASRSNPSLSFTLPGTLPSKNLSLLSQQHVSTLVTNLASPKSLKHLLTSFMPELWPEPKLADY